MSTTASGATIAPADPTTTAAKGSGAISGSGGGGGVVVPADNSTMTSEAKAILAGRDPNVIVDIRVSNSREFDAILNNQGYIHISADSVDTTKTQTVDDLSLGSFGRGNSIWVWRRKQGTCSGRLKPIVAIQLESTSESTALVLGGFTCLTVPISGQYVWIRRAENKEEEKDAILDIRTSIGNAKNPLDKIYNQPGPGWAKVENANFGKGLFSSNDAFLWYLPARARLAGSNLAVTARGSLVLGDESRRSKLCQAARYALRNHVAVEEMKASAMEGGIVPSVAPAGTGGMMSSPSSVLSAQAVQASRFNRFQSLSYLSGKFSISNLKQMLRDVGFCIDNSDVPIVFYHFDVNIDGFIDRDEFINVLALTGYELDLALEELKFCLTGSKSTVNDSENEEKNKIRINRTLCDVFAAFNGLNDGILSYEDMCELLSKLEIFLDEREVRRALRIMDGGDDRIEEKDFIGFMSNASRIAMDKANRLNECAGALRAWIQRNSDANETILPRVWEEFKYAHEQCTKTKFPGFLVSENLYVILARNNIRISLVETRELAFIVAPEKNGRINQSDLITFSKGSCRSYGELLALLERDIMEPAVTQYKKHIEFIRKTGVEDHDLAARFEGMMREVITVVKEASTGAAGTKKKTATGVSTDIVSLVQVKAGVEKAFDGFRTPSNYLPSLGEWATLTTLTGDAVVEDGVYGVHINTFVHKLCDLIVKRTALPPMPVEEVLRIIQRTLRIEAKAQGKGKKKIDYRSCFALFDLDGGGTLSADEFKKMLIRLKIADGLDEVNYPKVFSAFDRSKKGEISLDDFTAFAESSKFGLVLADDEKDTGDDDQSDDIFTITSNTPPVALLRDPDTDWLLWFLWKEASKQDKDDPESVITDLQIECTNVEQEKDKSVSATISSKDMWTLLDKFNLRGTMNKSQFDKGIKRFTDFVGKQSEERLDYSSLCSNIVRMGRSFIKLLSERRDIEDKRYSQLKLTFYNQLKESGLLASSDGYSDMKALNIMTRFDKDNDGRVSLKEFKDFICALKVKCEKDWSSIMVKRFFDEFSNKKDDYLTIDEFGLFIGSISDESKSKSLGTLLEDDDEIVSEIFKGRRAPREHELFKKVSNFLQDMVPATVPSTGDRNLDIDRHIENVRAAVRRFFVKTDSMGSGVVAEERFKTFCNKSGLMEVLNASELHRVIEIIRSKKGNDIHFVDYEKFCRMLGASSPASIPYSRAEAVLRRLQEAAVASNSAGRSFIALCSLVDLRFTGKITSDELIHTFKMMGVVISSADVQALKELLPDSAVDRDGSFDYREIQHLLMQRQSSGGEYDFGGVSAYASRHYASPMRLMNDRPISNTMPVLGSAASLPRGNLTTPGGYTISTPLSGYDSRENYSLPPYSHNAAGSAYEKMLSGIIDRTSAAIDEKSRSWGNFSILRQFEVFDNMSSGFVSMRTFQAILDEINVLLSGAELTAIQNQLGRPDDDRIDYVRFCRLVENTQYRPGQKGRRDLGQMAPYLSFKVIDKYISLKREGRHPRDMFEVYDLDRTGMVDVRRFNETIMRLELLQSEHQLGRVLEDFSNITDRSMIHYDDFCKQLELESRKSADVLSSTKSLGRIADDRDSLLYGSGRDQFTPRVRSSYDLSSDRDRDSGRPPIRVSDSASFSRGGKARYAEGDSWDSLSSSVDFRRSAPVESPIRRPRSPPSKVGAAIWGSGTPLVDKGQPLEVGSDRWCCPVCYYTENALSATVCELCDCPNVSKQKDHQIKEQCTNCTFMNGAFATECEMCLKPLSSGRSRSVVKSRTATTGRDFHDRF